MRHKSCNRRFAVALREGGASPRHGWAIGMRRVETVIIGGGIAGLACARRLHRHGRDFLLITDRLGGRMFAGDGASRNYGATYLTSDYRHVGRFVGRGRRLRFRDVYFFDGSRFRTIFSPENWRHRRALARLYARLIVFRGHLNRLRREAPYRCQADLLRRDRLLTDYVERPAMDFLQEEGLEELNRLYTESIVASTLFVGTKRINAFYYLATLMPILLPTYIADFRGTLASLMRGWRDRHCCDRVVALEPRGAGFVVRTQRDELQAAHAVVATPCHNTRCFCPALDCAAEDGVQEIGCQVLHVVGRRRAEFKPHKVVFLPQQAPAHVLVPLGDDCDLLFAKTPNADLAAYYDEYRVEARVDWKTAIVLSGRRWRCLSPRPNLHTIGDHNICGLEDSYLTGLYAANQVIGSR